MHECVCVLLTAAVALSPQVGRSLASLCDTPEAEVNALLERFREATGEELEAGGITTTLLLKHRYLADPVPVEVIVGLAGADWVHSLAHLYANPPAWAPSAHRPEDHHTHSATPKAPTGPEAICAALMPKRRKATRYPCYCTDTCRG